MQWISVGVNLSRIYAYAVLEWANDMKLHVFVYKHMTAEIDSRETQE